MNSDSLSPAISQHFQLAVAETLPVLQPVLISSAIALGICLCFGAPLISWLKRHFQERVASDSARLNQLHSAKSGTPTMGGLLILLAVCCGIALTPAPSLTMEIRVLGIGTALAFGALGAWDDLIKARTRKQGLSVRQKFLWQVALASGISICLWLFHPTTNTPTDTAIWQRSLLSGSLVIFLPWSVLVIVAVSNAVNLTDGLDGLAAGCLATTSAALAWILAVHPETSGLAVIAASLSASALGFLWFNRHPARVFMGDTGSLPAGALLAVIALAGGRELVLPVCGSVFLIETLSVIAQVAWFRRTRNRLLLCSPLHNHFVFQQKSERKIVRWFWLVAAISAVIAGGFCS
ncbi:MAG: phospho-N-acetylmuramoyl-pentapeptide-transferase [Planctomycetia bacterium]